MVVENLEIRVIKLEHWRNGNGARGAEERLRETEQAVRELELHHHNEGISLQQQINTELASVRDDILARIQKRDKAWVQRLKALAPYAAMLIGLLSPMLH